MIPSAIGAAPRTVLAVLQAARALLAPEGAWTPRRPFGALDGLDRPCSALSPEARRWGLMAALRRAGGTLDLRIAAVDRLCGAAGARWLPRWEEAEGRTGADVLALLDAAIALAADDPAAPAEAQPA